MARFERLSIRGFRRLVHIDMTLRPLTVIVGVNGAGKTSLLDALSLLSLSAAARLEARIGELGGIAKSISADRARELNLGTRIRLDGDTVLDYSLTLRPSGPTYAIDREQLVQYWPGNPSGFAFIDSRDGETRCFDPS